MARDRRLQRAVNTINLYGGVIGAAQVVERLNELRDPQGPQVHVPNLQWTGIEWVWRISNDRIPVYLAADVDAKTAADVQAEMAKRNRRSGAAE